MDKRNTRKEKLKNNKHFPYKSFVRSDVRVEENYFVIGKEDKEFIESFRLKTTATQKAMCSKKYYGRPVLVVTSSEYKQMCHDQKGTNENRKV